MQSEAMSLFTIEGATGLYNIYQNLTDFRSQLTNGERLEHSINRSRFGVSDFK